MGLWWNYKTDEFSFRFKFHKVPSDILNLIRRPSKREVLRIVMSMFDPLGFISNFLVVAKILLQRIWDSGIGWDETLLDEEFEVWKEWCSRLETISTVSIPRQFSALPCSKSTVQLHIFCNASKYAYGACAYLRFEYEGTIDCVLVTSKSRVAPLKPMSIPRLELQAALLGSRLLKHLKAWLNLKIHSFLLWSDSEVVLSWICSSSRRFKVFVAQRLGEIQEITDPSDWRYVPSKLNIAIT